MNSNVKQCWSLKARVTLFTLAIFIVSIWSLTYYASQTLHDDMQRLMGEQQFTTAKIVASQINQELDDRLKALESVASVAGPVVSKNPDALQKFLEQNRDLQNLFNAGYFIANLDGTAIASIPVSARRVGVNYMERDHIQSALKEGKARVSKPVIGKQLHVPVFGIAVPIRDTQGRVIGALAGVIDLSSPSFLDKLTENSYGKQGGYLLVAPQYRLVVTASDKSRIMQPLPAAGINSDIDRNIAGFEGYTVLINPLGVEQLASMKKIPLAGWYLAVTLPTTEAFAPIQAMQQRIILAAIFLTVLAGGLTWWMLKRLLSPILVTVATLGVMTESGQYPQALQVTRRDEIGQLIGGFNHLLEILAQREKAIRSSEKEFRLLAESIPQVVWICAADGENIYFNQQWVDYTGLTLDESCGNGWIKPFHPDDQQRAWDAWLDAKVHGAAYSVECRLRRADGVYKWWLNRGVPELDEQGAIVKWFGTCTDIDEIKKFEEERLVLERQFLQAQKLESLGVLSGGIAHDFNNILTAIIGNTELALMKINKESPAVNNLQMVEQAAARAADLANQMLAYSGKGKFLLENVDLNKLLEDILSMLNVSITKKAALRLNLHQSLPMVEADATQMRQIIMNLVINASEAIGEKSGIIAITTGSMDCDKNYLTNIWMAENITPGLYVYLEIADSGCGMDKETQVKIFDPFFTTKFTGRGLGMAAVLGIVHGHKGAIKVYSEPDKGTTFKILLPANDKPAEMLDHSSAFEAWQGNGRVLLVDDEEIIRDIGKEMLQELGFTAITAKDGREALETFKITPGIDFVLLDLTMPHMDGEQCFRELRQLNPNVKVIMSSGYNEQEVKQKFVGKGLAGFIQKPYKMSALRDAIMQLFPAAAQ